MGKSQVEHDQLGPWLLLIPNMQLKYWNSSVPLTVQPFQCVRGDSRNSGCELGRFVALLQLSGVTGWARFLGRLWLKGEEGAVLTDTP